MRAAVPQRGGNSRRLRPEGGELPGESASRARSWSAKRLKRSPTIALANGHGSRRDRGYGGALMAGIEAPWRVRVSWRFDDCTIVETRPFQSTTTREATTMRGKPFKGAAIGPGAMPAACTAPGNPVFMAGSDPVRLKGRGRLPRGFGAASQDGLLAIGLVHARHGGAFRPVVRSLAGRILHRRRYPPREEGRPQPAGAPAHLARTAVLWPPALTVGWGFPRLLACRRVAPFVRPVSRSPHWALSAPSPDRLGSVSPGRDRPST